MRLFHPDVVYPSDTYGGRYVEVSGPVLEVGGPYAESDDDSVRVVVEAEDGRRHTGWAHGPLVAQVFGQQPLRATMRVYDAGGGWYPDNRVTSLSW